MYGPAFALALLFVAALCVAALLAGPNRGRSQTPLQSILMVLSAVPLAISLIAAPAGVVMRARGARRLKALLRALEEHGAEPPAWPPVRPGELLGSWRVLACEDGLISLRREPFPWPLHALARRVIVALFVGMPAAIIVGMASSRGANQAGAGALLVLLVQGWFAQRGLRIERLVARRSPVDELPELEYTCTRPYFLPTERLAHPIVRFVVRESPIDLLFVSPTNSGTTIGGFSPQAAGVWQTNRLAAELAERLGFGRPDPSEDEPDEEPESPEEES
jgi:hypothetical protein